MIRSFAALALALAFASLSVSAQSPAPERVRMDPAEFERQIAATDDVRSLVQLARRLPGTGNAEARIIVYKRLAELRPHVGGHRYELAAAYAERDRKTEAYDALLNLQTQGYGWELSADPRFALVATTPAWNYIVEGMDTNRKAFGGASLAYTLPAEDLLLESMAWDPTRKQLLAGSAREGAVYLVQKDGKLKPLLKADDKNGLWAVFDVAVDAERGALWVASTAVPHFKGYDPESDLGRAGVFEFDLKSGKLRNRYLSPAIAGATFFMSSLALGPQGEVYAADGVNNAVYTVRDGELKRVFHAPGLVSIRGMAVAPDGRTLYMADHEVGLLGYDLQAGRPFEVGAPKTLALGGLDGLRWWNGHLIAVQGGMAPTRVMRFKLSDDGRGIAGVQTLQMAHAGMPLPTVAAIGGDQVYVLGNSQKPKYDRFGLVRDGVTLEGARIFRIDAGFSEAQPGFAPAVSR